MKFSNKFIIRIQNIHIFFSVTIVWLTFAEILNASNTLVQTTYFGDNAPTCTLSGTNNSQVNFVVPSGTVPLTFTVFATSSELDAGDKVIVFSGAGLLGNTSKSSYLLFVSYQLIYQCQ